MQRTFIATIAFALALTSVLGAFTASSYVKAPVSVAQNNETNFTNTNATKKLGLASITTGEVYLYAQNATVNAQNTSNYGWSLVAKKLEAKALTTAASPLIYNFNLTESVIYVNNYAIGFISETESSITNLKIYQVPLTTTGGAGAPLPKLTYTNNTNGTVGAFAPSYLTSIAMGKVVYVFYKSAEKTVNIASFTVGGTLSTTNTVLTTNFTDGLQVVWGEALGTSKVLAVWREGDNLLKDAVVDLTKTNATANIVEGYTTSHTCYAYATDKTLYGEICTATNETDKDPKNYTITYAVRTTNNGSKLVNFTTYPLTASPSYAGNHYAYGPYLIFDFTNVSETTTTTKTIQHFYEIWNFDNSSLCRPRTLYLQINDTASTAQNFRVVSGGLYTLFYDKAADKDSTLTNIQVGLLLGSSNLASVLGFLLTIIAGLLLF